MAGCGPWGSAASGPQGFHRSTTLLTAGHARSSPSSLAVVRLRVHCERNSPKKLRMGLIPVINQDIMPKMVDLL